MKYKSILELEIWSEPTFKYTEEVISKYFKDINSIVTNDQGKVLKIDSAPDKTDIQNLEIALRGKEIAQEDFETYCKDSGLIADTKSSLAAGEFLMYYFGRPLAWVHLNENVNISLLQNIAALSRMHHLVLVEPWNLFCYLEMFPSVRHTPDQNPLGFRFWNAPPSLKHPS